MKISWIILTFNRAETVEISVKYNLANIGINNGFGIEPIWVDNGSDKNQFERLYNFFDNDFPASSKVLNRKNLGVAKGYNRGCVLATGDYVLITGCDRKMPQSWLETLIKYFDTIPETGIISIYSQPPEKVPERFDNNAEVKIINGLPVIEALPVGAKMFRRSLLKDVGHLREDFGLYGWEDIEWAYRMQKICKNQGYLSYIIPDFIAEHLGNEGVENFNGKDGEDYHAFKKREAEDPKKHELLSWCRENGHPYYSPYL